ncbi:MAG: hypothetical protein KGJ41_18060 [Rhodospirillales bacterium]|nr:hypothetical protein [Rhodospirillales bacterium]MDE2575635.1 hypothetical protein [Rhodospirillales bacterium]
MDFIEAWLGFSPDGGDGSLEALWAVAILVAVGVVVFRHRLVGRLATRRSRRH